MASRRAHPHTADDDAPVDPGLITELLWFVRRRKVYWIVPLLIVLLLLVGLISLGTTAAAPFIYTLF